MPKVTVTVRSEVTLCLKSGLSNNYNTTQANLKKLHRKIKHSKKSKVPTFKVKATSRGWKSDHFSVIT